LSFTSFFNERKVSDRVREPNRRRERKEEERGRREREQIKEERGDAASLYLNITKNAAIRGGPAQ
jgi:hypothetical protein